MEQETPITRWILEEAQPGFYQGDNMKHFRQLFWCLVPWVIGFGIWYSFFP